MQTQGEVGKYVTDGKSVYPYNAHLDDLLANGKLQFCEKPAGTKADAIRPKFRSPIMYTADERLNLAKRMGITLGELTNFSPQEFETALAELETKEANPAAAPAEGFPS